MLHEARGYSVTTVNMVSRLKEVTVVLNINQKAKDFAASLLTITERTDIDPLIIFTHAWHESGGFVHVIGLNNYWGIKVPSKWEGVVKKITTHEFIKGVKTQVVDSFIDFSNTRDAISWYLDFIRRLYPNAFKAYADYVGFYNGLVNGKYQYATDPAYVNKLVQLYKYLKADIGICKMLQCQE